MKDDDFDWSFSNGDIAVHQQATIAVYLNPVNHVVVRQEGHYGPDEDMFVCIDPRNALAVAQAILNSAGVAGRLLSVPPDVPKSPATKPGSQDLFSVNQPGVEPDGERAGQQPS